MLIRICRDGELWLLARKRHDANLYLCYGIMNRGVVWMALIQPFAVFGGVVAGVPMYVVQGITSPTEPTWATRAQAIAQLLELCRPTPGQYLQRFLHYYAELSLVVWQFTVEDFVWERV